MIFVSLKIYLRLLNPDLSTLNIEYIEKMWIVEYRVFFLCWEVVGLAFSSSLLALKLGLYF